MKVVKIHFIAPVYTRSGNALADWSELDVKRTDKKFA